MTANQEVLVIGAGGHGKVVVRALQALGIQVRVVLDDDPRRWGADIAGVCVTGPVTSAHDYGRVPAVLAIGDNAIRRQLAGQLDLDWMTVVHPQAVVDETATIGPGGVVLAGAIVQPYARIGQHAIVNTAASVDHDCVIGDFVHVAPGVRLAGEVAIDEGAFVGIGCNVIPGIRIGAWTIVGAGATVVDNLPDHVVAVGVPAKIKKHRTNILHRAAQPNYGSNGSPSAVEAVSKTDSTEAAVDSQPRIYLSPPHMSPRERELLLDAFDSNWIAPLGPHVDAFEQEFAETVGTAEAVALSSGTAALHLSLVLLGVGKGDDVITSSLTFAATANAITYVGANPVFIDSDLGSWNMDPDLLGDELEERAQRGKLPKAVIAVDLYGQCADYDRILKVCQFYEVPLVEDAAEALGATYRGKAAGTFGTLGVFSFNGNKIITASGGGMMVTDRVDLAQRARFLATQARDPAPHYEHSVVGYNYRLSNLLAAVGRGQLANLQTRVAQRRANFDFYRETLGDLPGIDFMPEIAGGRSTRWLSCIVVDPTAFGATSEEIRLALAEQNIEARPLWKPMHLQPVFRECTIRGGAVAERLFEQGLCLPSGSNLTDLDRERVVETIRSVVPTAASRARRVTRSLA